MSWSHAECADAHGACPACGAGAAPAPLTEQAGKEAQLAKPARLAREPAEERASEVVESVGQEEASAREVEPQVDLGEEQFLTYTNPRTRVQTTPLDLLLLLLLGFACFAVSMLVFGAGIFAIGKLFDLFTGPGDKGQIVALAAMGSMFSTSLFLMLAARSITRRRADLEAAEAASADPPSPPA